MHSIRSKITILNVIGISIALVAATAIAAVSIAIFSHRSSEQTLELLAENGKSNLNYYFKSVEQSVNSVSSIIGQDLDNIHNEQELVTNFHDHMEYARNIFNQSAKNANGAYTYYYRIDLDITAATGEKGFWYVEEGDKGFVEHEVTDLSDDKFECVWFYAPKESGEAIWLPPYFTDNLDEYVISYNVPVYGDTGSEKFFVGVVGIEISYHTLGRQIEGIKAMDTGYAYIVENENGAIVCHPQLDLLAMPEEERPLTPPEFREHFLKDESHIHYNFLGVDKHCFVKKLTNGMSVVVCVPVIEITKIWLNLVLEIAVVALVIIGGFIVATIIFSKRITKSLKALTLAAEEINNGNYDVKLETTDDDEIGVLNNTFNHLIENLGNYINDLNALAYADALTEVRNKSAFDIYIREMQKRINDEDDDISFAVAMFDCDDLKNINDKHGHDKGNVYLRNSCHLICRIFTKSVVYRIGGDEFAVILQGEDFENREKLKKAFLEKSAEICSFAKEEWERIRVSVGIASYDPHIDTSAEDVMIRADHLMYAEKRERKNKNK